MQARLEQELCLLCLFFLLWRSRPEATDDGNGLCGARFSYPPFPCTGCFLFSTFRILFRPTLNLALTSSAWLVRNTSAFSAPGRWQDALLRTAFSLLLALQRRLLSRHQQPDQEADAYASQVITSPGC